MHTAAHLGPKREQRAGGSVVCAAALIFAGRLPNSE